MGKSKIRRQYLFDEFSANLNLTHNLPGQFGCPVCLKLFDSIEELSDAHIFPKALGGRSVTLTCRDCNNTIGSRIESFEVAGANLKHFYSGKSNDSLPARLSPNNIDNEGLQRGKVTAEMRFTNTRISPGNTRGKPELHLKISKKGSDPKTEELISQLLKGGNASINIECPAKINERIAKLTYLHSAFLFLFSQLGYQWVLNDCAREIRQQLQNPQQNIIEFNKIAFLSSDLADCLSKDNGEITWYQIPKTEDSRGFLIVFSNFNHMDRPVGVWMPLCGGTYDPPESIGCRVVPLEIDKEHLSDPKRIYSGYGLL